MLPASAAAATTSGPAPTPPAAPLPHAARRARTSNPSANGKRHPGGDRAAARSPARSTASRAESTRLTWPMPPDGGPVVGQQDRVGLHRTRTRARRRPGRRACGRHRRASGQPPGRRVVTGASTGRVCTSTPPLIFRNSTRPAGPTGTTSSRSDFFASARRLPSRSPGATTTSVKTSATCSASAPADRPVDRDHPAERGHRVTRMGLAVRIGHRVPRRPPAAIPHGLACLTIATAGSAKSDPPHAASAST